MSIFCFYVLAVAIPVVACRKASDAPPPAALQKASPSGETVQPANVDEVSCREFVQNFYDWYWNRIANSSKTAEPKQGPNIEDVLSRKPPVLSLELQKALQNEQDTMKATHEVGSLDFDPFLNSQDPQGTYRVSGVSVANGRCVARIDNGHESAVLEKAGSSWAFADFRYSFLGPDGKTKELPDNNLLNILKQ